VAERQEKKSVLSLICLRVKCDIAKHEEAERNFAVEPFFFFVSSCVSVKIQFEKLRRKFLRNSVEKERFLLLIIRRRNKSPLSFGRRKCHVVEKKLFCCWKA
jgi:hypothetical protein